MCFISGIHGQSVLKQGPEQGSLTGLGLLGDKGGPVVSSSTRGWSSALFLAFTDSLGDLAEKGSHTQLCLPAKAIMVS